MYDIIFVSTNTEKYKDFKTKYPIAKNAKDFRHAQKMSLTEFFWLIWDNLELLPTFSFDYVPDSGSQEYIHIFKNTDNTSGILLVPKKVKVADVEIKHGFFVHKKEVDIIASVPKKFDIVFISYQEENAEDNYAILKDRFPYAKRIHGIKGIHQAHIEAAKICHTDMFWIVDGDAVIVDDFNFNHTVERWDMTTVHVWRSINPVNDLIYGYGGVKLFPREMTINMDMTKPDMTTSISSKFKAMPIISNITKFNTSPYNTWKSAFRECCKLSSKIIDRQKDDETTNRLHIWTSKGEEKEFGKYAIAGAKSGAAYGARNKGNLEALKKINDFDWLKEQFKNANL